MDNREEIMTKIKNRELHYEDIPEKLKNDEEIALIAIETYDGRECKYMGDDLKNNKEFAKKVFAKKYGYSLCYFSNNVKNDFECCKTSIVDGFSGYRYIGEKLKDNKELALCEINRKYGHDIKSICKELRRDEDIIKAHWNKIYSEPTYFMGCSIIAIDDFGNNIIEQFKNIEFKRHISLRIDEYEEKTEEVQFIKCNDGVLEKEIFEPILDPLIIIIGNERNSLASKIIKKYYDDNSKGINIIEVYRTDVTTKNIKYISKNYDDIINFLRIITYTTAGDTWLTEDNLSDIRCHFGRNMENKRLETKLIKNISEINVLEDCVDGKLYICQIVSNNEHTFHEYIRIMEQIEEKFKQNHSIEYHLHNSCNISDYEIYFLKID